jgi:hypothetical protein
VPTLREPPEPLLPREVLTRSLVTLQAACRSEQAAMNVLSILAVSGMMTPLFTVRLGLA